MILESVRISMSLADLWWTVGGSAVGGAVCALLGVAAYRTRRR